MQAYIDTTEAEAIMPTVDEQTQQRQRIAAVVPVQQTATPELEISNEVVEFIRGNKSHSNIKYRYLA